MRLGSCIAIELVLGAGVALAGSLLGVWAVSEVADEFRREARADRASCESASESAVSGSGASFSLRPDSGRSRTSAGSAAG